MGVCGQAAATVKNGGGIFLKMKTRFASCRLRQSAFFLACAGLALAMLPVGLPAPAAAQDTVSPLAELARRSRGQGNGCNVSRQYMLECLHGRQLDAGISLLSGILKEAGDGFASATLNATQLSALLTTADALNILDYAQRFSGLDRAQPETLDWLFADNAQLGLVVENLTVHDNWPSFLGAVDTLARHDPGQRDQFLPLLLALALVWDQPRPPLHHQMGSASLPYDADLTARYDYFKNLYSKGRAEISLARLSVAALTFVVDTPVPVAELEWARDNIRGSRATWGRKFREIAYDHPRLDRGAYSWPHGEYTLAAIRERGGICVDQAYYAALSARAAGLPAMIFTGMGRRGPHAWFGYMKSETDWEMDVGRYDYDKYATGATVNPQTNQAMTDHDVAYSCHRSLNSASAANASRYTRIAEAFMRLDCAEAAYAFARKANQLTPLYDAPWGIMQAVLERKGDDRETLRFLARKALVFQNFPDYLVAVRTSQAALLRRMGRDAEAERLLNSLENKLDAGRGDLSGELSLERIDQMLESGDQAGARKKLEELMMDQRSEGVKVMALIPAYLQLTSETGQQKEGLQFMKRYIDRVRIGKEHEPILQRYLLQAYENAGDERGAERLRRQMR